MKTNKEMHLVFLAVIITAVSIFSIPAESAEKTKKQETAVVSEGKSVKVNYTLKVDGKVVDSSIGRDPIMFTAGKRQVIPGFEKAIIGMKQGQKKSFRVSPSEGYGPEDPNAVRRVPKQQIPPDIKPKAGMLLDTQGQDGKRVPVKVVKVEKDIVVLNFNHPLAGKTLNYDVEVLEIK